MTQVHEPASQHEELEHHPTPRQYVNVAIVLAIVTAAEVGLYYVGGLRDWIVVVLLSFMAVMKFALVVLWFMHLRFDSKMFRRLFVAGLGFALVVFTIVILTFVLRDPGAFAGS